MTARFSLALLAALSLAGCGATPSANSDQAAGASAAQAPQAVQRYQVGEARVTSLLDGRAPFPANLFGGIEQAESDRLLKAGGEGTTNPDGSFAWHGTVRAFLVEIGGKRVLIDAGGGLPTGSKLIANLQAAGVTPDQIDAIVISHMHSDHIGGLTDAAGAALFPRATLHLHVDEAGYWGSATEAAKVPQAERGGFTAAKRALDAYRARTRLFDSSTQIVPGLIAEPLVGHTPGHSLYRLRSGSAQMVFIGDMIHSLAVQMPRPDATLAAFDSDEAAAKAARAAFLNANAGRGILFAGPHFAPGVVMIARDGRAFRATPVPFEG